MGENKSSIKLVVVGDGAVGKTCLLTTYAENHFPHEYVPTVFDNFNSSVTLDGHNVNLNLWDTAGQEEYDRLRLLSYPATDVVIMCYNIASSTSLNNIRHKWIHEIKEHIPNKPILLVGTQRDKRDEAKDAYEKSDFVSFQTGKRMADELKLDKFMETSALKDQQGLKEVFEEACRLVLYPDQSKTGPKRRVCNFL